MPSAARTIAANQHTGARLPALGRRDRRARQAGAHRLRADGAAQAPSPSALALRATGSRGAPPAPRSERSGGASVEACPI